MVKRIVTQFHPDTTTFIYHIAKTTGCDDGFEG
jgi:hypothetical protein